MITGFISGEHLMKKKKTLAMLVMAGLLTVGAPAFTANAAWKTTSQGTIYTQTASPGYVTGFKTIDKKLYYFNSKGIMLKGWMTLNGKRYYADEKTGVIPVSTWLNNYYFQEDGSVAVNTWIDGKWVGANGLYTGIKNNVGWVTDNGTTYYYDATTHQPVKGWLTLQGKLYYLHPSTGALQKGWFTVGGKKYYAGPKKGVVLTNQWYSGKYLQADGSVATGWTKIGKKTYYFNSSGKKQTGWIKYNDKYYYFNKKGVLSTNTWVGSYYVISDGTRASGWTKIGNYTYYFTNGKKKTGWLTLNSSRYFLNKNGQLQTKRWLWSKNYYATSTGAVLKGFNAVGKNLYYFNTTTGKKVVSKLVKVGSDYYYFQKSGAAAKSKQIKISGKYYYFGSNGKMLRNTWVSGKYYGSDGVYDSTKKLNTGWTTTSGNTYYFNSSGSYVTGLQTIGNDKYYFNSQGVMQTGLQEIGGYKYYFYPTGKMATSIEIAVGTKQYTIGANGIITAEKTIKISGSTTGVNIVNYALKFVGNKYVYGGNSLTNGVDCSGFTQQVLLNFGIKIPRVADDQMKTYTGAAAYASYKKGVVVDTSSMQPGDLIFYGSGNYASHVGIYIGNGKIVHASNSQPYPAGGIKISNYNYQTPLKIIRYWS